MKRLSLCCVFALTLSFARAEAAAITNGSFETGDFTGWTVSNPLGLSSIGVFLPAGEASVGTGVLGLTPFEGSYVAAIGTGDSFFVDGQGTFDIVATQTFDLGAGSTLSGWSRFYNGDFEPQDTAWVRIYDSGGAILATLWTQSSGGLDPGDPNTVPYHSSTNWTEWSWSALTGGTYTLALGATTFGDDRLSSIGLHDGIHVTETSVPEPATLSLLAIGLVLVLVRPRP